MNKAITALVLSILFMACGGNINYDKAATQSGVEQDTLKRLCKGITCDYDDLKDRIEARASDGGGFMSAMGGTEDRKMELAWVSGWTDVELTVFDVFLYGSWKFNEKAELYIDKEKVADIDGSVSQDLGTYNQVANEHEKIESISKRISIETARKIAEADPKTITIRFYSKDGYSDVKPSSKHNMIQIVKLAETVR